MKLVQWSREEVLKLRELLVAKKTIAEIAVILGRSRGSVNGAVLRYARTLHKKRPFWTQEELDQLKEFRLDGYKLPEIAEMMGRTVPSVALQAQKIRSTKTYKYQQYARTLQRPHTIASAAKVLGVTNRTVSSRKFILRRQGYKLLPAKKSLKPGAPSDHDFTVDEEGSAEVE